MDFSILFISQTIFYPAFLIFRYVIIRNVLIPLQTQIFQLTAKTKEEITSLFSLSFPPFLLCSALDKANAARYNKTKLQNNVAKQSCCTGKGDTNAS